MTKLNKQISWILVALFSYFTVCFAAIEPDCLIVYPEQGLQRAKDLIIHEINQAERNVQMSAYQMKDPDIAAALVGCTQRNVKVELMLEENPYEHDFNRDNSQETILPKLIEAGVIIYGRPQYLKDQHSKGYYHARYILIDQKRFLLTTGNFDECTFDHCRDFAVGFNRDSYPQEFDSIQTLFINDASNEPLTIPVPVSVIIGPDQQREKIISFLNTAEKSIKLYQQYFNDPVVLDALTKLIIEKRVKVELLMMPYPTGYDKDPNIFAQDQLKELGADVRLILDLYGHARAIIVDNKSALIGTAQLSPPSLKENREMSLIIEGSVVAQLIAQFQNDQTRSVSLEEGRKRALEEKRDWNSFRLFVR